MLSDATNTRKLGFISDHETKVDLLRTSAIAATIIDIITGSGTKPLTIGVHGYWGAGKSSVLEMIAEHDFGDQKALVIRFNGWQFEGFEDAKIALIEGIVDQLVANKTIYAKAKDQIHDVIKRINWLKAAKRVGGLAFNLTTGLPSPDQIADFGRAAMAKIPGLATPENFATAVDGAGEYLNEAAEAPTVAKNIREFHDAFGKLIDAAELDRLIVLVDDLDRCLPETAIATLEAMRLFVMLPRTAFVIGADETMIQYAVKDHFPDLPDDARQDYPRAYLEKLIQVPFRIPAMGESETRTYLTLLVVGSIIGEDSDRFKDLLQVAEGYMSSPWLQRSIGDTEVSTSLGNGYTDNIVAAVTLADRIASILASGTGGNPRNVKRFMNSLTLRLAVANARGFGNAIDSQVLAKLMLAEQFATTMFEDIAKEVGANPNGFSESLQVLELQHRLSSPTSISDGEENTTSETEEDAPAETSLPATPVPPAVATRVGGWVTMPYVAEWARQHPEIGSLDLRPYLFVVNDVRNFTMLGSALDPALLDLVEKLSKGGLSASSALQAFVGLSAEDRLKVFNELRRVILGTTNWAAKPPALEGMVLLVNKVTAFERRYVELLSHLPASKLGRWAEGGHDRAVQTPAGKAQLAEVFRQWKATGSDDLKIALRRREGSAS